LLERLLDIISNYIPLNPLSGIEDKLSQLDPDKIYVENVRSLLNVSYEKALEICELAVRQGFFKRGVEIKCPNGKVAAVVENGIELPSKVRCLEEEDGFYEEVELPTSGLEKIPFYKLNDAAFLRQTA
jgi:hypothetical protein